MKGLRAEKGERAQRGRGKWKYARQPPALEAQGPGIRQFFVPSKVVADHKTRQV
jgi:hypothetical protein